MNDILFQITKDQLETGMRGYPVGYCITSFVDPIKGLFYREHPISELYQWEVERVLYLLFYGKKGSDSTITSFKQELKNRSYCSKAVINHIESLPRKGHPMKLLNAAILILGMLEGEGNYREDCLNLIAKIPHLVAAVINHHAGWGETQSPNKELGYMENFSYMLNMPNEDKTHLAEVFRLFNILHYDHGGGNLSCFVGKAIASGLEDMHGSICGAMCALAGSRHGKANQDCLTFVQKVHDQISEQGAVFDVADFIRKRLENKELIFGFGHAVLRAEDPRATILYDYAQNHFSNHPLVKVAIHLREKVPTILKENPKISNPYPNVDAISGALLTAAGFPYSKYYTVLFALARSVGIAIQISYERLQAREGNGTPIIRPKYFYKSL